MAESKAEEQVEESKPLTPQQQKVKEKSAKHHGDKDVEDAVRLIKEYAVPVLVGALLAAVVMFGWSFYKGNNQRMAEMASAELSAAQTVDQYQLVLDTYPKSSAAPVALISLAEQLFNTGDYNFALEKYREFPTLFLGHAFSPLAQLGEAHCLEGRGDVVDALAGFKAFGTQHPDHYLFTQSVFGEARCLEQLGKRNEARAVYEDYLAANPETPWQANIETSLRYLNQPITTVAAVEAPKSPPVIEVDTPTSALTTTE